MYTGEKTTPMHVKRERRGVAIEVENDPKEMAIESNRISVTMGSVDMPYAERLLACREGGRRA